MASPPDFESTNILNVECMFDAGDIECTINPSSGGSPSDYASALRAGEADVPHDVAISELEKVQWPAESSGATEVQMKAPGTVEGIIADLGFSKKLECHVFRDTLQCSEVPL